MPPKIGIYRIIGPDLPPRDIPGSRERVTQCLLSQEQLPPEIKTHWIVNRILDHGYRRRLQRVFDAHAAKVVVIPMHLQHVKQQKTRAQKLKEAVAINTTRNWAIKDGRQRGYDWVVVMDGDCMFTADGFNAFYQAAQQTDKKYIGIPSRRCVVYGNGTIEPVADFGEPMLAVHRNATQLFDESLGFGNGDKLKLLIALGCAPQRGQHTQTTDAAEITIAGWVAHLSLDTARSDIETDGRLRNELREKGLNRLLADVDRPRPLNAHAAINTAWKNLPGFFDYLGPYSGIAADVPDGEVIVEVGSWLGKSSSYLARELQLRGKTNPVYCVDTWEGAEDLNSAVAVMGGRDVVFGEFLQNTVDYRGTLFPLPYSSVVAAKLFADESVAVIFIDADHSYAAVLEDLKAWYPKLKPGGLICGHDYVPSHPISMNNVVKAVDEFFAGSSLELRPASRVWKHVKPSGGLRIWS